MSTRRNFLRTSGLSVLPALIPFGSVLAADNEPLSPPDQKTIRFFGDSVFTDTGEYIDLLKKIHTEEPVVADRYGAGGAVEKLEKRFCEITGKEKAIFMPSGTMANQFAIHVLSKANTKVFVQDTSHMFRDEADAAQSVFGKRLMPLAPASTHFTFEQLRSAIEGLPNEEVFKSGVGAVAIENPVRRTNGRIFPIEEIKMISEYCRKNNIGLHLDGARIYMASAWSGISVKEYSSYFDTVYISLYKYLGANAGAVLCGDASVINQMPHLMKIHGGAMYGNWTNAAVAHHTLKTYDEKLRQVVNTWNNLYPKLNQLNGIQISPLNQGSNIFSLVFSGNRDVKAIREKLNKEFNIRMAPADPKNEVLITINESILFQTAEQIVNAFAKAIA